jgi:hypothetical protein
VGQAARPSPTETTLLDLVRTLQATEPLSEDDLVEVALALVATRRVKLIGTYRDVRPAQFDRAHKPIV